jgi:hypothetical protein
MAEKSIKTRIINKHDTEAEWNKIKDKVPKKGELIIYDADSTYKYERFKIGDGVTSIENLPFTHERFGNCALEYDFGNECLNFTFK